ncbi:MAG TPA: VWA domain-containing protein, partial [Candidatus Altiarchaeales archaeon]|nr:VWA domain-containing protein [Candidatus Altiarchaeales archaeon]
MKMRIITIAVLLACIFYSLEMVSADGIIIPEPVPEIPKPVLAIKYHHVNVSIDNQYAKTEIVRKKFSDELIGDELIEITSDELIGDELIEITPDNPRIIIFLTDEFSDELIGFNIITFEDVEKFSDIDLRIITFEDVEKFSEFIQKINAMGGTNINDALLEALELLENDDNPRIIIFLTDGKPTVGTTNVNKILENVKNANKDLETPTTSTEYHGKIVVKQSKLFMDT